MGDSTPICRCRVLYLGSAVPRQSKDGLQGIQEPLRSLYPSEGAVGAKGIDSWLSVWSNGILLENVDENLKQITRFFPIESLHYCAAVRQVLIPERGNNNPEPKFLPLDSPFARMPRAQHPPIFAAILRRTTGIKVLECHVFICKREAAANALVRCCFHAYADNSYARQLETGSTGGGAGSSVYGTLKSTVHSKSNGDLTSAELSNGNHHNHHHHHQQQQQNNHIAPPSSHSGWRSRAGSTTTLNSNGRILNGSGMNGGESTASGAEGYTSVKNFYGSSADLNVTVDDGVASIYNDENHKVWNGSQDQLDSIVTESPYEIFAGNTSTLGRPARARQMSTPIDVPPPPFKEETNKVKREKKLSKSSTGSHSLSGTLMRPGHMHPSMVQRGGMQHPNSPASVIYGPISSPVGPHALRQYHTISHRAMGPPLAHMHHPGPHGHHGPHGPHPPLMHPPPPMSMQMPIMMPQQYATLQPNRSTKKKKKDKKGGIPVGMPIVPPMYVYNHGPHMGPPPPASVIAQSKMMDQRPLGMSNRKLAASMGNGLDDSGTSGAESPGGTGIYRRKGHMNERAFSYSIRQEHRSRSHGSLASLQFNPPDMKKEQEIAQMVAGLELKDTDERSMASATLQRKQMPMNNGGPHHHHHHQQHPQQQHHHHQAIYGNSGGAVIYGNAMAQSSGFGKPRR